MISICFTSKMLLAFKNLSVSKSFCANLDKRMQCQAGGEVIWTLLRVSDVSQWFSLFWNDISYRKKTKTRKSSLTKILEKTS